MINLPVLQELTVKDYDLYPGNPHGSSGLHITFRPGLTLVLGANGLGKTTLVMLIYRMLTGPNDIPALSSRNELGSADLTPTRLPSSMRRAFASRVADAAVTANATLCFRLGKHKVALERQLKDLSLTSFIVDGVTRDAEEENYQTEIEKMVDVWSFGDWILILRHLIFYFEDRRALVWDSSAQRQLLRALFLPAGVAQKWTRQERAILELDSRARNLSAVIYREEQVLAESEQKVMTGVDVRAELKTLEKLQQIDLKKRAQTEIELVGSEERRTTARLRLLKSEQLRESRFREVERAKLIAINARFPTQSDTAKYILAQLMTDGDCLVCGSHAPDAAAVLEGRIKSHHCVVCGSSVVQDGTILSVADKRVDKALEQLRKADKEVETNRTVNAEAYNEHSRLTSGFATLDSAIAARSSRIDFLVRQLPPGESEIHTQRSEVATMRGRLEQMRQELTQERENFGKFIKTQSRALVKFSDRITGLFRKYAKGFLFENCSLTWSPQSARVGQGGELIEFPAYELDLGGVDFSAPVRRTGPDQVSESQREFIDLAFRMALIEASGGGNPGSLVMDAPESSLDAVFAERAVNVLKRFASPKRGNRLVITSNLIEGRLIPTLVTLTPTGGDGIVNLFEIATPTAAVRENQEHYRRLFRQLTSVG